MGGIFEFLVSLGIEESVLILSDLKCRVVNTTLCLTLKNAQFHVIYPKNEMWSVNGICKCYSICHYV